MERNVSSVTLKISRIAIATIISCEYVSIDFIEIVNLRNFTILKKKSKWKHHLYSLFGYPLIPVNYLLSIIQLQGARADLT